MISIDKLSPLTKEIVENHMVRKTAKQKQAFRRLLVNTYKENDWIVIEHSRKSLVKTNNVIVGNLHTAKFILTAHYDTPARLPFPNFITPRSPFLLILSQLAMATVLLIPFALVLFFLSHTLQSTIAYYLISIVCLTLLLSLLYIGPANPNNANDNTSGVAALIESTLNLSMEERQNVAIVFFDNEEKGLLGSAQFRKDYGNFPNTPLLNFDCVGDGDTIAFFPKKAVRKNTVFIDALRQSFIGSEEKSVEVYTKGFMFYPSDQVHFACGIGVVALKSSKFVKLYVDKIHTIKDTNLDQENILLLKEGVHSLLRKG